MKGQLKSLKILGEGIVEQLDEDDIEEDAEEQMVEEDIMMNEVMEQLNKFGVVISQGKLDNINSV